MIVFISNLLSHFLISFLSSSLEGVVYFHDYFFVNLYNAICVCTLCTNKEYIYIYIYGKGESNMPCRGGTGLSGEGKEGLRGDGRKRASRGWKNTRVSLQLMRRAGKDLGWKWARIIREAARGCLV